MMKAAVTISLVPQARGGPFVFWEDLASACEKAAALGFAGIEVFAPAPEKIDRKLLRQLLKKHDLQLAALGTGAGWVLRKWHLAHGDAEVRRQARDFIRGMLAVAGEFGAPVIVGSMQGRFEGAVSREQAQQWVGEALMDLGELAVSQKQPLLFEPLNRFETNLFNSLGETTRFLKGIGASNVKILADLFHMNIEEQGLPEALREAGSWIGHVHFADSNRRAMGFGHTDMEPIIKALREISYNGYLSAEVLPWPDSEGAARQTMKAYQELVKH
jgi:sugar phosphate isomerase/epimerase